MSKLASPQTRRTFRIRAYEIRWSEKMACAHIITDVTTEQEYREQMEGFAYEDELTGLHNRRFCLENLEKLIAEGTEFTFCMIDLDGLKYANDNFGHGAGDEYLRTVSRQLLQSSRSSDLICRIGGDEFVAVFPNCKSQVVLEKWSSWIVLWRNTPSAFPCRSVTEWSISAETRRCPSSL